MHVDFMETMDASMSPVYVTSNIGKKGKKVARGMYSPIDQMHYTLQSFKLSLLAILPSEFTSEITK